MACGFPVQAFRTAAGDVVFVERGDIVSTLELPCGRCTGCRLERSRQWTVRIMHEASLYEDNCVVTLTYDDSHVPEDGCLVYRDFKNFIRRLRESVPHEVRYVVCGEYGDALGRPHFHAVLFNVCFREDRKKWRTSGGFQVYRSAALESLWKYGLSEVSDLSREFAGYVARYIMKKVTGDLRTEHYRVPGSDVVRPAEFLHMSLRPGIGYRWFERFAGTDVLPHDRVVIKGQELAVPRYYNKLWKRRDAASLGDAQAERAVRSESFAADNTMERRATKELVTAARVKFYKRGLK